MRRFETGADFPRDEIPISRSRRRLPGGAVTMARGAAR
jgi:hypothetical protein